MRSIDSYKEEWLRELLNDDKTVDLNIFEHGFQYVKDNERDSLDDSNIFNVLLKTKRFRAIEFRKEWIKIKLAFNKKNNSYLLLIYNKRKTGDDITKIMELNHEVDADIIKHVKKFINPGIADKLEQIDNAVQSILKNNLSNLKPNINSIKRVQKAFPYYEIKVDEYFKFILKALYSTDDDKIFVSYKLLTIGGDLIHSNLKNVDTVSDIFDFIETHKNAISDKMKETKRDVEPEEFISGLKKNKKYGLLNN
jgi:hypothetical protein